MANNYTPPGTINFYNSSSFTSDIIYYDFQYPSGSASNSVTGSLTQIPVFTPNSINIPAAGDYVISVSTGSFSTAGVNVRAFYKWRFSKAGEVTFDIEDLGMNIVFATNNTIYSGTFVRKVTFSVAGIWTLTPYWRPSSGNVQIDPSGGAGYTPWLVVVQATNPIREVNQQLTQFVDAQYTLMTNVHANAWWGSLTNATVAGYGTGIASNTSAISTISTNVTGLSGSVSALNATVSNLATNVSNLSSQVSGLTSISTISGGVRIKPAT